MGPEIEFELTENEKKIVMDLNKKVMDYLSKNNLSFDKNSVLNFKVKFYGNLSTLDNSELSDLILRNLEDLSFLQSQSVSVRLAIDYLKFLKENYANKFRLKYRDIEIHENKKKQSLADIERELYIDPFYISIKYLIFIYESNYFSRILANLELVRAYKDILIRELSLRTPIDKHTK